jgi:hypothetical protein
MTRNASNHAAVTAAMLLVLAACGGDATSPTDPGAAGSLSASQVPPGTSGDTARTNPPPPTPASAIELAVYVGIASPGPDTLASTPAANARVSVLRRTFTPGTGPDTLIVTETLVASGTTDALGHASFANLPAAGYRIEAVAGTQPNSPTAIQIAPPYPSKVAASIIIRPVP